MSDVSVENVELDYEEERNDMYNALSQLNNRKRVIAGGVTILTGVAAGFTWKARKKIKNGYKKVQYKHLSRRKEALEKETAKVEARMIKMESHKRNTVEE